MSLFVVTSANIKTWDMKADHVILAEPGCLGKNTNSDTDNRSYITLENNLWDNCESFQKETDFLNNIQTDILKRLTVAYNKLLGRTLDTKDINRILYPWLDYYIDTMFYKFYTIENIQKQCSDIYVYGLEEKDFYFPSVPMDFMIRAAKDDLFNLQLYTSVAEYKGINIKCFIGDINSKEVEKLRGQDSLKRVVQKFSRCIENRKLINIWYKYINIISRNADTVIINPTRFLVSEKELLGLFLRSKGKIGAYFTKDNKVNVYNYSKKFRDVFPFNREDPMCDFECFLLQKVIYDIPINCMEGIRDFFYDNQARKYNRIRKIVSDSSATCDSNSMRFIVSQGGNCKWYNAEIGGSGNFTRGRNEVDGEERISDVYYTNGWTDQNTECEHRPFYNPRFLKAAIAVSKSEQRHGVLYGGTFVPRYRCIHDNTVGRNVYSYLDNCLQLLEILYNSNIDVTARLYPDAGWGLEKKVVEKFPDLRIDKLNEPFVEAVKNYQLYMCDVLSTTWGEAYVAGIPIIIVGNRKLEHYSAEANKWIEKLRNCGIYQEDAYRAGRYVVSIMDNIEEWWKEPERQEVMRQFAQMYANFPSDLDTNVWITEIEKISQE